MKLLAIRLARSIWLIPQYFLNPRGIHTRPVIEAMTTRYEFIKSPRDFPFPPPPGQGLRWEGGMFNGKEGAVQVTSVAVHEDGLILDTRSSTDDCDAFLEDVVSWVSKEFGLPTYAELPIRRIYASELNVVFPKPPAVLNPSLKPFLDDLSSVMADDRTGKPDFLALQISTDQTRSRNPLVFKLEREINTPFEENRYYSFAPMKTALHIKLLEQLEKLTS